MERALIRVVLSLFVIVATGFALDRVVAAPYRCALAEAGARKWIVAMMKTQTKERHFQRHARVAVAQLEHCVRKRQGDEVAILMDIAASYRILGRHADAVRAYQAADQLDHRPEIYYSLGTTYGEMGDDVNAVENLARAAIADPRYLQEPIGYYDQVEQRVMRYREQLGRATTK